MNWLRKFMYGRYGVDQLCTAMLVISMVISLVLSFTPLRLWGTLLSYAVIIYMFFRILSRNYEKRRRENEAFMRIWRPIAAWFSVRKRAYKDRSQFCYFKCPKCHQQLRAPRGRGKIQVTCQKCHNEFVKKV